MVFFKTLSMVILEGSHFVDLTKVFYLRFFYKIMQLCWVYDQSDPKPKQNQVFLL